MLRCRYLGRSNSLGKRNGAEFLRQVVRTMHTVLAGNSVAFTSSPGIATARPSGLVGTFLIVSVTNTPSNIG